MCRFSPAAATRGRASTGAGVCGAGPDFCGTGCTSECTWKSDCDPGWGLQWSNAATCPLNVCCSHFGFCGTTADFCAGNVVSKPECAGRSSDARTIGYYEGWNGQRACGQMKPKDIPLGYYTHIFYSFALIDPTSFHIAPMDTDTASHYDDVAALKGKQDGLQVWIGMPSFSGTPEKEPLRCLLREPKTTNMAMQLSAAGP